MAPKSISKTTVVNASKMNDVSSPTSVSSPSTKRVKSKWSFRRNKSTKNKSNSSTSSQTASIVMTDEENAKTKFLVENPSSPSSVQAGSNDTENKTVGSRLDLVVLLMHPLSHRFELLQLEFDEANRAKVSDLLAQIPLSITEACLKNQLYDSILDQDSADQGKPRVLKSTRLVEAFDHAGSKEVHESLGASSKMVLVARPQGVSDFDALKMAKPIFTNKDIANMLELSGFDVSCWKSKKFSSKSAPTLSKENRIKESDAPVKNSLTSYLLLGFVFAMIIGNLLQSTMVQPVSTDLILKPGSYKSKCGLSGFIPMKSTARNIFKNIPYYESVEPEFLSCQDKFLRVNYDGTATLYDSDKQAVMILTGEVCDNQKTSALNCVNGLVMKGSDKTLNMGGKSIKQVLVRKSYSDKKLSPWPFEEEPAKLKYKVGSANAFSVTK